MSPVAHEYAQARAIARQLPTRTSAVAKRLVWAAVKAHRVYARQLRAHLEPGLRVAVNGTSRGRRELRILDAAPLWDGTVVAVAEFAELTDADLRMAAAVHMPPEWMDYWFVLLLPRRAHEPRILRSQPKWIAGIRMGPSKRPELATWVEAAREREEGRFEHCQVRRLHGRYYVFTRRYVDYLAEEQKLVGPERRGYCLAWAEEYDARSTARSKEIA